MPISFQTNMRQLLAGLRREQAKRRVKDGDEKIEGKKKMDFAVYQKMCELMFARAGSCWIFAHLFLVLEWNLMMRAENCADAHVSHLDWCDDALIFHFAKTKTDQVGENAAQGWHVFANPANPAICPILALVHYLFANPGVMSSFYTDSGESEVKDGQLFPGMGKTVYRCFNECFQEIISDNAEEFAKLGVLPGDLGSHSARKGAASWVA